MGRSCSWFGGASPTATNQKHAVTRWSIAMLVQYPSAVGLFRHFDIRITLSVCLTSQPTVHIQLHHLQSNDSMVTATTIQYCIQTATAPTAIHTPVAWHIARTRHLHVHCTGLQAMPSWTYMYMTSNWIHALVADTHYDGSSYNQAEAQSLVLRCRVSHLLPFHESLTYSN